MQTKSSLPCFALISNIIRNTLGDFRWKCRWNIRWKKMCAFLPAECLHRIPCLFHVWTIRRVHVRHTGDNGRTFWCRKGHTQKSYKLSSGVRTWPVECSKLGKTRIIEDATIRLVRNAIFFEPNIPSVFPHEIPKCVSCNITYQTKARYASCDTSSIFISIQCFSAMRYTPSPSNAGIKLSSAVSPSWINPCSTPSPIA